MDVDALAQTITPNQAVLLLGAGASIPSGAPTGAALARYLATRLTPPPEGDDLAEVSGIYENRLGRAALVESVRTRLADLKPTGGLLALPDFDWRAIYSTNFDRLVEDAYQGAKRELAVIRSNFDFSRSQAQSAHLYKIHGCLTQDVADGSHSRMLLTEADYDEVAKYRQALFNSLAQHMMTADTLIVGQSLRDTHLKDLAKEVSALREQGVPGRVFLLAYEYDEDRAQLYAQRGIIVIQGALEHLLLALTRAGRGAPRVAHSTSTRAPDSLPSQLVTTTVNVLHAAELTASPTRLFNGSPATYADIQHGFTIRRAVENRLQAAQTGARGFLVVLSGAAGVGKTSLARALMLRRAQEGFACWEHSNSFPLDADGWLEVEAALRAANRQGILLIDDCAPHLSAVNRLVDGLGTLERPHLRVLLTANSTVWKTRAKSKYFFTRGSLERLSLLTDLDISEMVNLVDQQAEIRKLVEDDFLLLGRLDKVRRLRDRCSADMFVCLKNIFRNENLDNILLQEFADLEPPARDVYRHVAAVQAMGGKVHRQLVVRLTGVDAGGLQGLLGQMEDVVGEYDVNHSMGLYGWATRHDVIAAVIATYKFAEQDELYQLLERLIEGLNPTVHIELETARAIASNDMGINRLSDVERQKVLLHKLIAVVPAERTPRRRLVRLFLKENDLPEADRAITNSRKEIGEDNIINRYRAILAMRRAEHLAGILDEDRQAMLLEAERLAKACISRQPTDRYNYRALADVGVVFAKRFSMLRVLDEAIVAMRGAESDIPDPDFAQERGRLEAQRRRYAVTGEETLSLAEASLDDVLLADSEG